MTIPIQYLFGCVWLLGALQVGCWGKAQAVEKQRPNVLFIAVDDLNDWTRLLDSDSPIEVPNLERLAAQGTLFTRAYCASPACNPSRVATLTGLRPTSSGVYGNKSDWRKALPRRLTLMQRFMRAGYQVEGAGKIFHHHLEGAFHDVESFHDFQPMPTQYYPSEKLNASPEYGSRNTDWGVWPPREELAIDHATTQYCLERIGEFPQLGENRMGSSSKAVQATAGIKPSGGDGLESGHPPVTASASSKPRFLACGLFKPHSPFFAPPGFHRDASLLDPPPILEDDRSDLPEGAFRLLKSKNWFWRGMMEVEQKRPGSYAKFIEAYAACVTYSDYCLGKLLDELDRRELWENTVIVLWSDHGFHLGEKEHIEKFALWEKSTHVPLIVVAPGVTQAGTQCDRPVDLSALYPTLLELCGLEPDDACDGASLLPLLRDPSSADWQRPAVMTYQKGNHAVRSARWRYIRYADGSEELYDHQRDAHEWHNLAEDAGYGEIKSRLRAWIPTEEAEPIGDLRIPSKN